MKNSNDEIIKGVKYKNESVKLIKGKNNNYSVIHNMYFLILLINRRTYHINDYEEAFDKYAELKEFIMYS